MGRFGLMIFLYLCLLFCNEASTDVNLSPASWPDGEYEKFERLNLVKSPRPKPLAVSNGKGMVTGTTNSFAVHAGMDALRKGGNAMDACLATALTEVALALGSYVSYTGVTNILYYDKKTDKVHSLDGGWNVPKNVDPPKIPPVHTDGPNGASVLVPGFMAGVEAAAEMFAKFPLSTLLEPAIYFAENGFKLPWGMQYAIASNWNSRVLLRTEAGRKKFTNPSTGQPYKYQELIKQPEMALFLRNVSKQGAGYVYTALFARDLATLVQEHGGTITTDDMENYQATWNEPASTTYSGHEIFSSGADWGGAELAQKLNLMELAGLGKTADTYLTNSTKLFWLASISRVSFFLSWYSHLTNGRERLESAFGVNMTTADRKTKANAEALWEKMGSPEKMKNVNAIIKKLLGGGAVEGPPHGSDGVIAVDSEGNACAMIHTSNSLLFGTGLFVQGNALPHSGAIFISRVKTTEPGTRLPSALQPLIALKGTEQSENDSDCENSSEKCVGARRVRLAVSVVGESYSMATPQFVTSVLDSHMTPKEALQSPTILLPSSAPANYYQDVRMEEFAMDEQVLQHVRDLGQSVTEVDFGAFNGALGLGVIASVADDGTMYGASNPDRTGFAEGV